MYQEIEHNRKRETLEFIITITILFKGTLSVIDEEAVCLFVFLAVITATVRILISHVLVIFSILHASYIYKYLL